MPMDKDPAGGGTNTDGTRSTKYCSLCYDAGAFRQPDLDVAGMQALCIEALHKKGMPRFMGWVFTRSLPRLERWKV